MLSFLNDKPIRTLAAIAMLLAFTGLALSAHLYQQHRGLTTELRDVRQQIDHTTASIKLLIHKYETEALRMDAQRLDAQDNPDRYEDPKAIQEISYFQWYWLREITEDLKTLNDD